MVTVKVTKMVDKEFLLIAMIIHWPARKERVGKKSVLTQASVRFEVVFKLRTLLVVLQGKSHI